MCPWCARGVPVQSGTILETLASLKGTFSGSGSSSGSESERDAEPLSDEAVFLRNVLVGGLGLALIPILLPVTMNNMMQQTKLSPSEEVRTLLYTSQWYLPRSPSAT